MEERLQKILAQAGIASRRSAEQLIRDGRIRINGQVVVEMGYKADPAHDRITCDGNRSPANKRSIFSSTSPPVMSPLFPIPKAGPSSRISLPTFRYASFPSDDWTWTPKARC
jgi:hypothetical protein